MTARIMPTADEVAVAIVAACRVTREDPLKVIGREPMMRARHYALHSLSKVFTIDGYTLARLVGCPADPKRFWDNSRQQKFKPIIGGARKGKRQAQWWNEEDFEGVIAAIRAVEHQPIDLPAIELRSRAEPVVIVPREKPAPVARHRPTNSWGHGGPRPAATPGKRTLVQMMEEAAAETLRIQEAQKGGHGQA